MMPALLRNVALVCQLLTLTSVHGEDFKYFLLASVKKLRQPQLKSVLSARSLIVIDGQSTAGPL